MELKDLLKEEILEFGSSMSFQDRKAKAGEEFVVNSSVQSLVFRDKEKTAWIWSCSRKLS